MTNRSRDSARPLIAPRKEVVALEGYHSPQLDVDVRLNTNEAPEPPPQSFIDALSDAVTHVPLNRYPDREAIELRRAIGALHGLSSNAVFCGNGSNEVIQSLLLAYGGPTRRVALFEPTYALHSHIARITDTPVVEGERDDEFLIDEGEMRRVGLGSDNGPEITFICSPNNPTGRIEPLSTIEKVLSLSRGIVVVDEAYGQFADSSAIELLGAHRNLVVVRTFSKTWSLAALRLGYAVADPEIIEAMFAVTLPYHLDALKQRAGVLALEHEEAMYARVDRLVAERFRLLSFFESLGITAVPSDANFILFKITTHDANAVWGELVSSSVLVRDVSGWPRLSGFLRVTIGTKEENDVFIEALSKALSSSR